MAVENQIKKMDNVFPVTSVAVGMQHQQHQHDIAFKATSLHVEELQHFEHMPLSWRSWVAILSACLASFSQIYAVVSCGFILGFIVRDLGSQDISGWIIQGPLLIQCVLCPIVGRLSDVLSRKYLAAIPTLFAFIGSVISAKASSMTTLIGGGILIGATLSTIAIIQAIPSEVLPLKFRPLANGLMYLSGAMGGLVAILVPGAFTNTSPSGWHNAFWLQAGLHFITFLGLILGYHPVRGSDFGKLPWKQILWSCDPVGSFLFVVGCTFTFMALNWAGTTYPWSAARVAALLAFGLALIVAFCLYEWRGRSDGLVSHVFFKSSPNFVLAITAYTLEGWVFYSAINNVLPSMYINLGFESSSWGVSLRHLSNTIPTIFYSGIIILYATKSKDLRSPLIVCYIALLASAVAYCFISPSWGKAQYGLNVVQALGVAGPFTLLTAIVQFSSPHAYLSTATGLAFSARALGGAFGSAVLNTIINNKLKSYPTKIGETAIKAGLPASSVPALLKSLATGTGVADIEGLTPTILGTVMNASQGAYTHAYRLAWAGVVPFAVLALVAVCFLKSVKALMTERIEASVERVRIDAPEGKA